MTGRVPARATGGRFVTAALAVGLAGALLTALGLALDPRQAWFSYLAAFAFGLSLALGALLFVMLSHVVTATWFVLLRRLTESVAATLPLFALLFVPLLFGLPALYPWADPAGAAGAHARDLLAHKRPYLNVPFFVARAALYFGLWVAVGALLRRWSLRHDETGAPSLVARLRALSAAAFPPLGLTLTFAAFDWLMSLTPEWYSTVFGVYYFSGGFLGAIALVAVLARGAQLSGLLPDPAAPSRFHALGKLLLTFVVFWAYIAFVQYLIIWIADIPAEISWYLVRTRGGWGAVALFLAVGHFALPFLALLSFDLKRRPAALAAVALWLLVVHYVDVYWLVMPALHREGPRPHWLDLASLAGVVGLAAAFGAWRLSGHAVVPRNDPRLAASLGYRAS